MVKKLNWTSFSILYDTPEHYFSSHRLLKMYGPYDHPVYAFNLGNGPNYR